MPLLLTSQSPTHLQDAPALMTAAPALMTAAPALMTAAPGLMKAMSRLTALTSARNTSRLLRWLLSCLTFCVALLSLSTAAEAAPIGMCSELGESIAAPPPLYASKDIQLSACDSAEFEAWDVPAPGRIPSGIDMPQEQLDKSFLLSDEFLIAEPPLAAQSSKFCLESSPADEHRSRLSRPPRS